MKKNQPNYLKSVVKPFETSKQEVENMSRDTSPSLQGKKSSSASESSQPSLPAHPQQGSSSCTTKKRKLGQVAGLFSIKIANGIPPSKAAKQMQQVDELEALIKSFFLDVSAKMSSIDTLDLTIWGYQILGQGLEAFALETDGINEEEQNVQCQAKSRDPSLSPSPSSSSESRLGSHSVGSSSASSSSEDGSGSSSSSFCSSDESEDSDYQSEEGSSDSSGSSRGASRSPPKKKRAHGRKGPATAVSSSSSPSPVNTSSAEDEEEDSPAATPATQGSHAPLPPTAPQHAGRSSSSRLDARDRRLSPRRLEFEGISSSEEDEE